MAQSTFTTGVQLLLTGENSRRTMFSGNAGILISDSFTFQELTLESQEVANYAGATRAFAIVTDGPVQFVGVINNITNTFIINSIFILTCAVTNIVLTNTGSVTVNARLALVS